MITGAILSSTLFFIPPAGTPPNFDDLSGEVCAPLPPAPSQVEFAYFDGERADGTNYTGSTATYELSTGDVGEAHLLVDSDGFGEAYFAINGEIVAHSSISEGSEVREPTVTTWIPTTPNYPAELIAELMQRDVGVTMIDGMVPQEFKCSKFGRKAVKAGKYMWIGLIAAGGAACCLATSGGCILCAAGAAIGAEAGSELADGYCD